MNELKKNLNYIDKTNWFFDRETIDFTEHIPFEVEANDRVLYGP